MSKEGRKEVRHKHTRKKVSYLGPRVVVVYMSKRVRVLCRFYQRLNETGAVLFLFDRLL